MKKFLFLLLAATFALTTSAAEITYTQQGEITFSETTVWGDIDISFKKCMANELFTFYYVKLNGKILNQTGSDNIGPFLAGGAWMGGNHPHATFKSGNTLSVEAFVKDFELKKGETVNADILTIKVKNELLYADGDVFAYEYMTYHVSGNSIEVIGEHTYEYDKKALNVNRYYGMQSMFVGETEILTPGGPSGVWQKITNTSGDTYKIDILKKDAPNFCTFIEHNNNGYQASYMLREDLGNREWVKDNDIVFTGNNWSKSYHKIIGDFNVSKGMSSRWHGIYSWFDEPITDNCRSTDQDLTFEYGATIQGKPVVMHIASNGEMKQQTAGIEEIVADSNEVFAYACDNKIVITADAPNAVCVDLTGKVIARGAGSFPCPKGVYIVNDLRGRSVKLIVK